MSLSTDTPYLTIIVPAFNELPSLPLLIAEVTGILEEHHYRYEIIVVNDGSTDTTREYLDELAGKNKTVKVIHLRRNSGQTAAMMAGIDFATGEIIIPIDADLQNDAHDIPLLLQKIDKGYDVCSGWRKKRKDNPLLKTLPSTIANRIIQLITGVKLHDYGCTLKAYRREIIKEIRLYGEMHRFIPIYAKWHGASVTEIPVNHRIRAHGKSHYGLKRTIKVILDLMVAKFMQTYFQRPIYVFGGFGLGSLFFSLCTFGGMLYYKYFGEKSFIETPLPFLAILFFLVGIIALFMGLLAQISMMTYYESQNRSSYFIAYTRNME